MFPNALFFRFNFLAADPIIFLCVYQFITCIYESRSACFFTAKSYMNGVVLLNRPDQGFQEKTLNPKRLCVWVVLGWGEA